LGVLLKGQGQGGGVTGGEDLADAEGGDLLGGFVDFGVIMFAEEVKEELDLGVGLFAAFLFGEPEEIAGLFPTGDVAFGEPRGARAEQEEDLGIGDALAEHAIEVFADVGGELADFVTRIAGEGGEIGWRQAVWRISSGRGGRDGFGKG